MVLDRPILVTIRNNILMEARAYKNAKELEEAFIKECKGYGIEPTEANMDDGYIELEDGTSINMTWI